MKIAITCHYQKLRTGKTRISPAKVPLARTRIAIQCHIDPRSLRCAPSAHATARPFPPPACHLGSPAQHAPTPPARRTDAPSPSPARASPAGLPTRCVPPRPAGPPTRPLGRATRRAPLPAAPTSFYSSRRRRACGCRRHCLCGRFSSGSSARLPRSCPPRSRAA